MADVKVPALLHKMSKSAQKAWYKKHGMEMPAEKSVAQSGKIKAPEKKKVAAKAADKPKTAREISMERQKAYYAKGGRAPIGAAGSGGHSSMAGVGQSTVKDIVKGIRAGVNPKGRALGEEVEKKEEELPFTPDKKVVRRGKGGPMSHAKWLAKQAMMKKMKTMKKEEVEPVLEQDDSMEKKEMAQTQLHFIKYAAEEILEFIDMGGEIEEWYQNKLSKVQSEVESLHSYIEGEKRRTGMVKEEEQIDEVSPPGAKFERMVKHIKKGYAKGGLTKQEKGIAYATAWKAYNKKNEEVDTGEADARKNIPSSKEKQKEVFAKHKERMRKLAKEEVVTEAEGTVAVTPREKALAAHHGDPKKITYGDVIKARLKSVAAKKMGK